MQRFTLLLIDAARPCRHLAGDRWFVDETYVKVSGVWSYVYRAVDQHGQVIDVYVSRRRDIGSARMFFIAALTVHGDPGEVITDRAPALANVVEELLPAVWPTAASTRTPGRMRPRSLKARLRPMRGVKTAIRATTIRRGGLGNRLLVAVTPESRSPSGASYRGHERHPTSGAAPRGSRGDWAFTNSSVAGLTDLPRARAVH